MKLIIYYVVFIFIGILFWSCKGNSITIMGNCQLSKNLIKKDSLFYVNKIDSLNDYYIIHLKKNKYFYKVISAKGIGNLTCNIQEDSMYYFSLKSIWSDGIMLDNGKVIERIIQIECEDFPFNTTICIEKKPLYIHDLFFANNLRGLSMVIGQNDAFEE